MSFNFFFILKISFAYIFTFDRQKKEEKFCRYVQQMTTQTIYQIANKIFSEYKKSKKENRSLREKMEIYKSQVKD